MPTWSEFPEKAGQNFRNPHSTFSAISMESLDETRRHVDLWERIISRDMTAVGELYERHTRLLFGLILTILADPAVGFADLWSLNEQQSKAARAAQSGENPPNRHDRASRAAPRGRDR